MQKIYHVALIPDGNRRWAKSRNLPTIEGHRRGFNAVTKIGKKLRELNIQTFTVWAFSTENWKREKEEIDYLMRTYEDWIHKNLITAHKEHIRIVHIGRKDRIPESLRKALQKAEDETKEYTSYYFVVAIDYGGRDEVFRTMKRIQSRQGRDKIQNEEDFAKLLDTNELPHPEPDMIIRTSGEKRLSGFLPWQSTYAELFFVNKHLPDFTPADLIECLEEYGKRQRRFGK